jgi:endonuclease YncB( thermonuclease family)
VTARRALLVLALPLAASHARGPEALAVTSEAAAGMHSLWNASVAARTEQVACLASVVDGDTLRITRVEPLAAGADSLAVSAAASLETCGPPAWQGTVHTHIALTANQRPYALFSGSDRGIMLMWWQRWKSDGTFCLLYAEDQAHCEIDGSRVVILPTTTY